MKDAEKGRGLFYHRDSGGKAEMTPAQYVEWACREADKRGVSFDGTADRIETMIRQGRSACGDLFLDYGVSGNVLSRDGLNALTQEALSDSRVACIFVPRRDRLARPDDPLDGFKLEKTFRQNGKTLVFMDRVLSPLSKGKRQDLAELITTMVDYDRSGQDRRDLAQKILYAQLRLAKMGFSTGGRAPYGFRRWLVRNDGEQVRALADGERVRMLGHHVVWLPTAEDELTTVRRILEMLETMPASRVAARLTAEEVPSPDAGRQRKDHGVKHPVSGVWHQTTVVNIARNPLLGATVSYGRRSMGDQLRFSPHGPRELNDEDYCPEGESPQTKPKVIRNADADQITAPARFDPLVDAERHKRLVATLDARAGSQRGKPRSPEPTKNPLGCRVFDLNCTWPMYREPYNGSFRYKCGLYQQSHGAQCSHNHVDGMLATRFVLSCLRQRLLTPRFLSKLECRLQEIAAREGEDSRGQDDEVQQKRSALAQAGADLERVSQNLALAETPEQYKAVAAVFEQIKQRQASLTAEIAAAESRQSAPTDPTSNVQAAMALAQRLTSLATDLDKLEAACEVIKLTDTRLFLAFESVQAKRRLVNRVASGVVTFGSAPPPVAVYQGPTGQVAVKEARLEEDTDPAASSQSASPKSCGCSVTEVKSLGNVSRGDRT
jgi:hypothetical protein